MTEPLVGARWIVVPPFRGDAAWRAAAAEAASRAGFQVYDAESMADGFPIHDRQAVIIAADAAIAFASGAPGENIRLIISGPGAANPQTLSETGPQVAPITNLMARAALAPPDRIFRYPDFSGGPLNIFEDIPMHAPAPEPDLPMTDYLAALTEAVQLLDPATPAAKWRPALFNYDSRRAPDGAAGELDLTGRPRFMITGPYITLPPGNWRAVYRLTFDEPGSRARFRLDWGSQTEYLSEEFTPGRAGVFEIAQDYVWNEAAPAELRVVALEGIFDGRMTFHGADVSRI